MMKGYVGSSYWRDLIQKRRYLLCGVSHDDTVGPKQFHTWHFIQQHHDSILCEVTGNHQLSRDFCQLFATSMPGAKKFNAYN